MIKSAKFEITRTAKGLLKVKDTIKTVDSANIETTTSIPDSFDFVNAEEDAVKATKKALVERFKSFLNREFEEDLLDVDRDDYIDIQKDF